MNRCVLESLYNQVIHLISSCSILSQLEIHAIMPTKKRKFKDEDNSTAGKDKVVTEGDAKLKILKTLSYVQEISDMLSEIINQHYKDSTGGQLHQSKAKTK